MGILEDFFSAANDKVGSNSDANVYDDGSQITADFGGGPASGAGSTTTSSANTGPSFGSQLFDVIYAAAAGKASQARETLVRNFLRTGEGKKIQATGVQQTVQQYLP